MLSDEMKRGFADIDSDFGNFGARLLMGWHRLLLQAR